MILFIILGILLGALAVVFALQNVIPVTVGFLSWEITGSLSVVLFAAIVAGALISLLISVPEAIKNYVNYRSMKKQNIALREELETTKRYLTDAQAKLPHAVPTQNNLKV